MYPEVIPFAVVIISGIISNSSCEQKKCPSLPKAVTTSSEIYKMSYFLQTFQKTLDVILGGTIQRLKQELVLRCKLQTLSDPISNILFSNSFIFSSQNLLLIGHLFFCKD